MKTILALAVITTAIIKLYARGSEQQLAHLKIGQITTLSGNCRVMSLGLLLIRD